jgi:hypothetical protein
MKKMDFHRDEEAKKHEEQFHVWESRPPFKENRVNEYLFFLT